MEFLVFRMKCAVTVLPMYALYVALDEVLLKQIERLMSFWRLSIVQPESNRRYSDRWSENELRCLIELLLAI